MPKVHLLIPIICLIAASHSRGQSSHAKALEEAGFLFVAEGEGFNASLKYLEDTWEEGYIPVLLDVLHYMNYQKNVHLIIQLLSRKTRQNFGDDLDAWNHWLWNQNIELLPNYDDWMAGLYENIDQKFSKYFMGRSSSALIRLDEIKWGGVIQDGIPPLRDPKIIPAEHAAYLDKNDVVFGVSINGDHRAYPKRILAWHEMFVDDIGGLTITGVYCTLCGTVIAYESQYGDEKFDLGTSGFLYRSNKLMYDAATQSLWNTIEGTPVLGPLVDKGIVLPTHPVVTTTWGEWNKLHPQTQVLSLNTGHKRDYTEGKAYEDYFATDQLMFQVPSLDERLNNKDEVFVIRSEGYKNEPLAISVTYLRKQRIYHDEIQEQSFVVLTNKSGANRAYASKQIKFNKMIGDKVRDEQGNEWQIKESHLEHSNGTRLERIAGHRIFWFAWYSMYPETRLVR